MAIFEIVRSFFWIRFPGELAIQSVEEDGKEGENGKLGLIEVPHSGG